MDDARIEQIRREVLSRLGGPPAGRTTPDLESRIAALEAAVAELRGAPPGVPPSRGRTHPALQVLGPGGGGERCVMEPDRPCVQSHACRTFGH
ncbi:MAG TPA: hypothetical protein VMR21_02500 [Vicinamibacteria bacterium]|nr:hypothetical protein [Vicinamibacteria bacterium]